MFVKILKLVVLHTAFFKETLYFGLGENNWFRFVFLGFNEIVELFVDLKNCIVGTVIAKGFFYQSIEGVTLGCRGQWCGAARRLLPSWWNGGFRRFWCSRGARGCRCFAVVELREKESPVRHFHQPVTDTVFDIVGLCVVVQACLGELDRADALQRIWS